MDSSNGMRPRGRRDRDVSRDRRRIGASSASETVLQLGCISLFGQGFQTLRDDAEDRVISLCAFYHAAVGHHSRMTPAAGILTEFHFALLANDVSDKRIGAIARQIDAVYAVAFIDATLPKIHSLFMLLRIYSKVLANSAQIVSLRLACDGLLQIYQSNGSLAALVIWTGRITAGISLVFGSSYISTRPTVVQSRSSIADSWRHRHLDESDPLALRKSYERTGTRSFDRRAFGDAAAR
jgi:hypothetical protein